MKGNQFVHKILRAEKLGQIEIGLANLVTNGSCARGGGAMPADIVRILDQSLSFILCTQFFLKEYFISAGLFNIYM